MARLTEQDAERLAWDFVRRTRNWWQRRRIGRRPLFVRLVTRDELARIDIDAPTRWFVTFPVRVPKGYADMDPDPSQTSIVVEDASGACSWVERF